MSFPDIKKEESVLTLEKTSTPFVLVIYNDDFNTFDHVIDCLIEICNHSQTQAEQCTMLIHYKGKCEVKKGEYEDLKPRCLKLLDKGLSAKIE